MDPEPKPANPDAPTMDLDALRALLARVEGNALASQDKTFFSIGRRGHWENPASDVLAFFLNPREQHGFGSLFLRTFFGCLGVEANELDLECGVNVNLEERLDSAERIDLVLRAPGWVLAIENKINHWAANDFSAYATHVRRMAGKGQEVHLALLAPAPESQEGGWKPVAYRDFCAALQIHFEATFPALPTATAKWQVFAREFVAHLRNLLYSVPMKLNAEQIALIEGHFAQIETLKRFSAAYTEHLIAELRTRLAQVLPDHPPFIFWNDKGFLVCDAPGGERWRLTFMTPAHEHGGNPHRQFSAGVCLSGGSSDALRQRASIELAGMTHYYESGWWWETHHDGREPAVVSLCEIARRLLGPKPV